MHTWLRKNLESGTYFLFEIQNWSHLCILYIAKLSPTPSSAGLASIITTCLPTPDPTPPDPAGIVSSSYTTAVKLRI